MSDLTKEHPEVEMANSMKACLLSRQPIKLIQPIPNSENKRVRQMEVNRYIGLDTPVVIVISDEEADADETDQEPEESAE